MWYKIWELIKSEPFVVFTGLAAFVHSAWSLTIFFNGKPPDISNITTVTHLIEWGGAVIPAVLLAFAVDVGQIATSADIRKAKRKGHEHKGKSVTFFTLAFVTFYLQWLYIAHHMPIIELGAGVNADWQNWVTIGRDLAVFILPALLPVSTYLYTNSAEQSSVKASVKPTVKREGQAPGKAQLPVKEPGDIHTGVNLHVKGTGQNGNQ